MVKRSRGRLRPDPRRAGRTVRRASARLYQKLSLPVVMVGAFLGLLYCLIYFLINSGYAVRAFDRTVNPMFQGRIAWERITWGPLPWRIRVLGGRLLDANNDTLVYAREVRASVDLLALTEFKISAWDIEASDGRVKVEVSTAIDPVYGLEETVVNIPQIFQPPGGSLDDGEPSAPPHLHFTDATLRNIYVTVHVEGSAWLEHKGINVDGARFELTPKGLLRMGATELSAAEIDLKVGKDELDTRPIPQRPEAAIYHWTAERVQAQQVDWEGLAFTVGTLRAQIFGDTLTARNARMDLEQPGLPYLEATATFNTDDIAKQLAVVDGPPISGPVKLQAKGRGQIFSMQGTYQIEGRGLSFDAGGGEPWRLGPYAFEGRARDNQIYIERGEAEAYGGALRLTGALHGEQGALNGRAVISGLHPERLPPGLGDALSGRLKGVVGVQIRDLYAEELWIGADARLDLRRFDSAPDLAGFPLGKRITVNAAMWMKGGDLHVTDLDLASAHLDLSGGGQLDLDAETVDFKARIHSDDVSPLARGLALDAGGPLTVDVSAQGPLADLDIDARTVSSRLRFAPTAELAFSGVALDAHLGYRGGDLRLKRTTARLARGQISVSGTVGVGRPGTPLNLKAQLQHLYLADLPLPPDLDVSGVITGRVKIGGAASRPQIDGALTVEAPRWQRLAFERITLDGRYSGQQIEVRDLTLTDSDRDLVVAKGALDLRKSSYQLDLKVDEVALSLVNQVIPEPIPIQGRLSVALTGEGTFEEPQVQGKLSLSEVIYGEIGERDPFDLAWDAALEVSTGGRILSVKGSLSDSITLSADVPLYPDGPPTTASVRFDRLTPDDPLVRNFVPPLPEEVFTEPPVLSGTFTANGDAWTGALYEADLEVTTLRTRIQGEPLSLSGPLRLVYRDEQIQVKRLALVAAGQRLQIGGAVDLEGFLDLQVSGAVNLAQVHPFLLDTFNSMRGEAWLDLKISGPLEDPVPSGVLTLNDAYLTPKRTLIARELELLQPVDIKIEGLYGPNTTPGNFSISLPDRRVSRGPAEEGERPLNRLVMRRDDGEIYINGVELVFSSYVPTSLVVKADGDNLAFNMPDLARGVTNLSDLQFELIDMNRPQVTRMTVAGDIYLVRAEYVADIYSTAEIGQGVTDNFFGRAQRRSVSPFERIPLLKRLEVDLLVNGDNDIFVRNQVATLALDMEIRPLDMHLYGNLYSDLEIDGQVQIITDDSTITFSGRAFEVIEGQVSFDGDNFLEANLRAQRNFEIRGNSFTDIGSILGPAGGELDEELVTLIFNLILPTRTSVVKPDIRFESSSGAPQIDVLSLVLTGRRVADLNAAATAQPALEVALSPLLSYFERPLEETLELDLSVVPQTTGTVEVDVDKKLGQRVRLFTRAQVGDDDAGSRFILGAEYQLNNVTFGELTNARLGLQNSTTARLRFRWTLD